MSPSSRLADAFRFTTLAIALASFLPIIDYQQPEGDWSVISWFQVVRLHLAHSAGSHPGMFLVFLPSLLALVSMGVPSERMKVRQALAGASFLVSCLLVLLVTWPSGLAHWFGLDALLPAMRFGRYVWMMAFMTVLWLWLEVRPEVEQEESR